MSHFTKLDRANITNADAFAAACKELGLTDVRKNVDVKDYYGHKETVDVAARAPGARYDIAIKKNASGRFDMVADWWGVRTHDRAKNPVLDKLGAFERGDASLQDALLRTTTKHTLIANYRRQGFVARVQEDAKHNITVTLTRGS